MFTRFEPPPPPVVWAGYCQARAIPSAQLIDIDWDERDIVLPRFGGGGTVDCHLCWASESQDFDIYRGGPE